MISADYSQLELRLLAHITQDAVMLEAFQKGEDIHNRTARLVFGAKTDAELKEARRFCKDRQLRDRLCDRAVGSVAARRYLAPGSERK